MVRDSFLGGDTQLERNPVAINVFGLPAPQGSKRIFNGRLVEASSVKLNKWRKEITSVASTYLHENGWEPFDGPVQLRITFYLPRPKTVKRDLPTVPPDLDKLIRAVGDGLTDSQIWKDDSLVVSLVCEKVYADEREPGAEIEIHSVTV